ncbi:MAG: hypothetical protein DHS20C02_00590 [Micavibrio sp.]|nr:MAG: hypothetical protein DHS20C02_00590 [Micavibrio sp.]
MCWYEDEKDRPTVQQISDKAELVFTGVLKKRKGYGKVSSPDVILIFKVLKVHKGNHKQFNKIDVGGLISGVGGSQKYEVGSTYTIAARSRNNDDRNKASYMNVADLCEMPVIVKAHLSKDNYSIEEVNNGGWFNKLKDFWE